MVMRSRLALNQSAHSATMPRMMIPAVTAMPIMAPLEMVKAPELGPEFPVSCPPEAPTPPAMDPVFSVSVEGGNVEETVEEGEDETDAVCADTLCKRLDALSAKRRIDLLKLDILDCFNW